MRNRGFESFEITYQRSIPRVLWVGHATMLADMSRRRILIIGALGKLLKTLGRLECHETQTIIEDLDDLPKLPRGMTKMTLWSINECPIRFWRPYKNIYSAYRDYIRQDNDSGLHHMNIMRQDSTCWPCNGPNERNEPRTQRNQCQLMRIRSAT